MREREIIEKEFIIKGFISGSDLAKNQNLILEVSLDLRDLMNDLLILEYVKLTDNELLAVKLKKCNLSFMKLNKELKEKFIKEE